MSAESGSGPIPRGFGHPKLTGYVFKVPPKDSLPHNSDKVPDGASSRPDGGLKLFDGSRLWAVVIGVNTYPYDNNLRPLSGAVSDALAMREYLTNDLGVPSSNIRLITEGKTNPLPSGPPTRDNILNALYDHLRDNESVKRHDNILIYFAGHGSSYPALDVSGNPDGRAGSIEAICPADRGRNVGADMIPDISDREINIFLSELCREKGTKITAIHDCCYAGGMARGLVDEELPPRFGEPLPDTLKRSQVDLLLTAADNDPRRKSWSQKACSDAYEPDDSTCVHLAACCDYEQAHEFRYSGVVHGVFTHHLLSELRASNNETTYWGLQKNLQALKLQQPQVIGSRVHSRLWYSEDLVIVQQDVASDGRATPSTSGRPPLKCPLNSEEIGSHTAYATSEKTPGPSRRYSPSHHGRKASFTIHDTHSFPVFINSNTSSSSLVQGSAQLGATKDASLHALRPQAIGLGLKKPGAEDVIPGKANGNSGGVEPKGRHQDREPSLYGSSQVTPSRLLINTEKVSQMPIAAHSSPQLPLNSERRRKMPAKKTRDERRCCIM